MAKTSFQALVFVIYYFQYFECLTRLILKLASTPVETTQLTTRTNNDSMNLMKLGQLYWDLHQLHEITIRSALTAFCVTLKFDCTVM